MKFDISSIIHHMQLQIILTCCVGDSIRENQKVIVVSSMSCECCLLLLFMMSFGVFFLLYFTFEFDHFCFSVMTEVAWYVIHHGCI